MNLRGVRCSVNGRRANRRAVARAARRVRFRKARSRWPIFGRLSGGYDGTRQQELVHEQTETSGRAHRARLRRTRRLVEGIDASRVGDRERRITWRKEIRVRTWTLREYRTAAPRRNEGQLEPVEHRAQPCGKERLGRASIDGDGRRERTAFSPLSAPRSDRRARHGAPAASSPTPPRQAGSSPRRRARVGPSATPETTTARSTSRPRAR